MKKKTYIVPEIAIEEFEYDANLLEYSYTPPTPPTEHGGGLNQDEPEDEEGEDDWGHGYDWDW